MTERTGARTVTQVYLQGDPTPIIVDLEPVAVLATMQDAHAAAAESTLGEECVLMRLPFRDDHEAFVRPRCVSAILPMDYDPDAVE